MAQRGSWQYYAGPHLSQGVENLGAMASALLNLFGPGADVKDYTEASQSMGKNLGSGNYGSALLDGGYAGSALLGMLVPGSVSGYKEMFKGDLPKQIGGNFFAHGRRTNNNTIQDYDPTDVPRLQDWVLGSMHQPDNHERALASGYDKLGFHSTKNTDPGPFIINPHTEAGQGFHVGTYHAAHNRQMPEAISNNIENMARDIAKEHEHSDFLRRRIDEDMRFWWRDASIMPLLFKSQNPAILPDFGKWDSPSNIINKMENGGWGGRINQLHPEAAIPESVYREFYDFARKNYDDKDLDWFSKTGSEEFGRRFIKFWKDRGYDSVKYRNKIEDDGNFSYMLFDPGQARSIFADFKDLTSGNIMGGLGAGLAGSALFAPYFFGGDEGG